MNDILQACLLGLIQGFTEFLPVSSSAHLILLPKLMGWQDFGLPFDIAIHIGSLFAIVGYFFKDRVFKLNYRNLLLVIIATIPVGLSGLLFKKIIAHNARSITLISVTTIVFGILLGISYWWNKYKNKNFSIEHLSIKTAILIGCAQAIAIIPGVSRSGITLTAGLLLGFTSAFAARFSFLLAIPVIFLAGCLQLLELIIEHSVIHMQFISVLISGFFSSMISSFVFVWLFLKFINQIGMWPFVIYRILLGSLLWASSSW